MPLSEISNRSPTISTSYNHGWSRLAYNNPPNPATVKTDYQRLWMTTPQSIFASRASSKYFCYLLINFLCHIFLFSFVEEMNRLTTVAGAFTYPHGRLTTFELEFGPKGWFVRYLYGSSTVTATRFIQTVTSQAPVVKWNSTWRYFRRPRPRTFLPRMTTITTTTTTNSPIPPSR